ncbi:hypothetical protein ABVV53_03710 [Novosphingobium sp. RD2P27]|uniref:Uncharacterized protein n=1 Tax=Novosphingobium kalidii TaxID=3230299 RepID=A0ABV2CY99_9SPHN
MAEADAGVAQGAIISRTAARLIVAQPQDSASSLRVLLPARKPVALLG